MVEPSPQQIAELVRDAMLAGDHATKMLGMRIVEVALELEGEVGLGGGGGACRHSFDESGG